MSSSAFAFLSGKSAGSRGTLTNGSRKLPATPAEDLLVVVDASQVVRVLLPFNTARAPAIRQYAQSYLVDENNRRVLIFRKDMDGGPAWTNIALDATAYEPKLTMAPYELCVLVETKMSMCPDVARVLFKSTGGAVITLSDIERIEFLPLTGVAPEPVAETVTTAEDVVNAVDTVRGVVLSEMATMEARLENKLTHVIAVVEKMAAEVCSFTPTALTSAAEARSASSARKRSLAAQEASSSTPATSSTRRSRTSAVGSSSDPIIVEE